MNDTKLNKEVEKRMAGNAPWQMTKSEYEKQYGKPSKSTTVTGGFSRHKDAVETAINRGLKVPENVLADYPDLKSKAGK
jgi:hypothetical protein